MKNIIISKLIVFSLFLSLAFLPNSFETKAAWGDPVRGKNAMVASQHELASKIGIDIMKKGGNAVDAAIAVGFALAVVYPEAGNLGGGGFMVIRTKDGKATTIDYREMAPKLATRDIYVDEKGELIRGEGGSIIGYRAAGVPGTPAGFEYALKKYGSGKISWSQLIEPSRKLAEDGYVLSYRLAELFKSYKGNLEKYEDSKKVFLNNGNFYEEGDLFKQTDLARTLSRMQKNGAKEFYEGETAKLIASDMQKNKGLITLQDLKNYVVKERVPVRGNYRGHEIISMPPPSSGGIVLVQILNMLEQYDLDKMGYNSAAKYHILTEAMRRAFADRAEYMGDPDFASIPTSQLIQKDYAIQRSKSINLTKASNSKDIKFGEIAKKESMDTTHYTIMDKDGTVVSNTYTINNLYGSAVTAKGTGVLLNDEMDDFAAQPGKPNLFGLVQGERNAVGAMKRPLSSMTPTIVLKKDGTFWFALGARGGPRIITAVLQATINMIDHKMNIQEALDAPRIHHQWLPDMILFEPYGMSNDSRTVLEKYGHKFAENAGNLASATAVAVDENGVRLGAIDSRSDGKAVGY
ncbi:MAG: gamma-glutamyltransferase [Acidobacteriota bacterium]|jgi:gamma-glutamyltranspeptidase/glutathione hydrolase|nr:gamma-glutamyltransferase [Acidobacteriota bacterium]